MGRTVKEAALLTGIPAGSISHYYARFNKDREKYRRIISSRTQTPPYSNAFDVAAAGLSLQYLLKEVANLISKREYGKARDLVELIILMNKVEKTYRSVMVNVNPEEYPDVIRHLILLIKMTA
jgi:hypothetical protein